MSRPYKWITFGVWLSCGEVSSLGGVDWVGSPARLTEKRAGLLDVDVGGLVFLMQEQEQRPGRQGLRSGAELMFEGRVAGAGEAAGEAPSDCRDGRLRGQGVQRKARGHRTSTSVPANITKNSVQHALLWYACCE
jgi:hypothetical protein